MRLCIEKPLAVAIAHLDSGPSATADVMRQPLFRRTCFGEQCLGVQLAKRTKVCHNAFAVGIITMIPSAGITQTESKPDEIDTRRTHTRRL